MKFQRIEDCLDDYPDPRDKSHDLEETQESFHDNNTSNLDNRSAEDSDDFQVQYHVVPSKIP